MRSILCIDDSPNRYTWLVKKAAEKDVTLLISCSKSEIEFYLLHRRRYNMIGICLDHDLGTYLSGADYARDVLDSHPNLPTLVVSNNTVGADNIIRLLMDNKCDVHGYNRARAGDHWAEQALMFFRA